MIHVNDSAGPGAVDAGAGGNGTLRGHEDFFRREHTCQRKSILNVAMGGASGVEKRLPSKWARRRSDMVGFALRMIVGKSFAARKVLATSKLF